MNNSEEKDWKREVLSWIVMFAVCAAIAWSVNQFVIVNALIPSSSMENTLEPGNRVIGLRMSYTFSDPKRGDIIVFRYPVDDALGKNTVYIKRIIGLPGEKVELKNAKVYINDSATPLEETYLKETWVTRNDGYTFEVPEGCYLMMGDNRNNSGDSRYWAELAVQNGLADNIEEAQKYSFVTRDEILGKALFRYWPINQMKSLKTDHWF